MKKFTVLKKDLPTITVFVIIVCFISALPSCGSAAEGFASLTQTEDFEKLLAGKEALQIETLHTDSAGNYLYKAPNALISPCYLNKKRNSCLLLRKINKEGKTYLQFVKAEIVASNEDYQIVKRLKPGDVFLESPRTLLRELARKNKLETRKRFLRLERY